MRARFAIALGALMIGCVVGFYAGARYELRARNIAGEAPAPIHAGAVPRMSSPAPLSSSPAAASSTRPTIPARDTNFRSALIELQRRKLVTSKVELVSDGLITTEFAELFALTPAQRDVLQRKVDAAKAQLEELERENTSMSREQNGDVVIAIKAFPEAGGATYDDLLKSFAATLGPEKYNEFLALGAEQTEKALGRFGTRERVISFSRETSTTGEALYRIRERTQNAPNDSSNYVSDRMSADRFAREIGSLVKVLPPDFIHPR